MHIEKLRNHCITKKGVTEHFPFDNNTLVFKVMSKIFALTRLNSWENNKAKVNLKCDPKIALKLRGEYESINPAWHMNKKHWNTVTLNDDILDEFAFELIDHSYELVINNLSKKLREELLNL